VENVSILMPVQNGSIYLSKAKSCISENILANDQIVIVNDNSTDDTLEFLQEWAREDPRVLILNNDSPGLVNALNLGVYNCTSNWIARFDVDDIYSLDRLAKQRTLIAPEIVGIFSDYWVVSENGHALGKFPSAVTNFGITVSLLQGRRTAHPSALLNRQKIQSVGLYKIDDFPAEDLGLWLRLINHGIFRSVPEPLLFYTLSKTSVTLSKRKESQIKKRQLIQSYFASNCKIRVSSSDLDDLVSSYGKLLDGFERYIYFFIEVFLSRRNLEITASVWAKMFFTLLLGTIKRRGFESYFNILNGYLLRRKFRRGLVLLS
jgi:glycosyltransferase involved in cell wall biosynthesis